MLPKMLTPLAAGLLLAGCGATSAPPAHEPAPPPPTVETSGDCGAQRVQDRVGRDYTEALGEAIRAESGAGAMRVMRPGDVFTMEYRGDRINVRLDEGGRITDIGCG